MTVNNMDLEGEVPVIDLAGIHGPKRKSISEQIAKACEEWGFFLIINHGVDLSLMEKAEKVYTEFFYLPVEEKQKWSVKEDFEGWCSPQMLNEGDMKKFGIITPDSCEFAFHIVLSEDGNQTTKVPTNPPALRPTILQYVAEVKDMQERILAALSEALGLEEDCLRNRVSPSVISTRANFYPMKTADNSVGSLSAHSDVSVLTFLQADKVSGLEIKKDDHWIQVKPLGSAFIVNVGDALEMMSNGRFRSVEHRAGGNQTKERLSIATFYGASSATTIGPLEELLDELHPARYSSSTFGEMLDELEVKGLKGKGYVEAMKIKT